MRIVTPYAKPLWPVGSGILMLRDIEQYARVSHRSEDKVTDESWRRFIQNVVLDRGDWSVTEHCSVSVEFLVDRGITHEIVRHRIGSYTQESTRFVRYSGEHEMCFVSPLPAYVECPTCDGVSEKVSTRNAVGQLMHGNDRCPKECLISARNTWIDSVASASLSYEQMLTAGFSPQVARSVLPNALASKIIVTYNLRGWRHFFLMRTSKEAHPQMRQVVDPLLTDFKNAIPLLYDDIEQGRRQVDNMRLPR